MHVKTHRSDNVISHKDFFLFEKIFIWSLHHWICSEIFQVRKMRFLTVVCPCLFLAHFNEIVTQLTKMIWKILSSFFDSDGINSQIKQNGGFFHTMFHPRPDSYRDCHLNTNQRFNMNNKQISLTFIHIHIACVKINWFILKFMQWWGSGDRLGLPLITGKIQWTSSLYAL